jgi:hypothetical protein
MREGPSACPRCAVPAMLRNVAHRTKSHLRHTAHAAARLQHAFNYKLDYTVLHWPLDQLLGDSFLFFETQRSGAIESAPGGNRIPWRGNQLLEDGKDVGANLTGGHYEAGSAPRHVLVCPACWTDAAARTARVLSVPVCRQRRLSLGSCLCGLHAESSVAG